MPLYRLNADALDEVPLTSFEAEGVKERDDLQRLLRDQPEVLEPGLFVIAEEFGNWEGSARRIDLLAVDQEGRLVVVELKRTEDGGFMDLQSIRYASMVSNITFDQLVEAHAMYMTARGIEGDAEAHLRTAPSIADDPDLDIGTSKPRILLVSADFSRELSTSILWLNDVGLDIRCIRMRPYRLADGLMVEVSQVLPLPEPSDYIIRFKEKAAEAETAVRQQRRERTLQTLLRIGKVAPGVELVLFSLAGAERVEAVDDPLFKVRVGQDPTVQNNMVWGFDGEAHSLSFITEQLRDVHGVPLPKGALNGFYYWRLRDGPEETLWKLAEDSGRRTQPHDG